MLEKFELGNQNPSNHQVSLMPLKRNNPFILDELGKMIRKKRQRDKVLIHLDTLDFLSEKITLKKWIDTSSFGCFS